MHLNPQGICSIYAGRHQKDHIWQPPKGVFTMWHSLRQFLRHHLHIGVAQAPAAQVFMCQALLSVSPSVAGLDLNWR